MPHENVRLSLLPILIKFQLNLLSVIYHFKMDSWLWFCWILWQNVHIFPKSNIEVVLCSIDIILHGLFAVFRFQLKDTSSKSCFQQHQIIAVFHYESKLLFCGLSEMIQILMPVYEKEGWKSCWNGIIYSFFLKNQKLHFINKHRTFHCYLTTDPPGWISKHTIFN